MKQCPHFFSGSLLHILESELGPGHEDPLHLGFGKEQVRLLFFMVNVNVN